MIAQTIAEPCDRLGAAEPWFLKWLIVHGDPVIAAVREHRPDFDDSKIPLKQPSQSCAPVPTDLDEFNGHKDSEGNYHYHATKTFPYINGGLRGVVTMLGDQIEQPRDSPVRAGQQPLRGATITGFNRTDNEFDLGTP